jgi:hypothetical protein
MAMAFGALGIAGCPSLDALECHGSACEDASAAADAPSDAPSEASAAYDAGVFCGPGVPTCTAGPDECCLDNSGQTSCTSVSSCTGTDIFCDDPSQCPGGEPCWICVTSQGFQGTSCDFDGDIVGNDHCTHATALQLCHSSVQCTNGTTCKPLQVDPFDAGAGTTWFQACQP